MLSPEPVASEEFDFQHMARRPMYQRLLEWFAERCTAGAPATVVDLGCGSGGLTSLLLQRLDGRAGLRIIGADPSAAALEIARAALPDPRVELVHAEARQVRSLVEAADLVVLCNLLHLIDRGEHSGLFEAIHHVLRPGGRLAFSTLYYADAVPPETRWFYSTWMLRTLDALQRRGIKVDRKALTASAHQRVTADDYRDDLARAGYSGIEVEEPVLEWTLDDWKALSRYSVFIRNTLGPVDLATGSAALQEGAAVACDELGLERVPRRWLHVHARR